MFQIFRFDRRVWKWVVVFVVKVVVGRAVAGLAFGAGVVVDLSVIALNIRLEKINSFEAISTFYVKTKYI